MVFNGAGPAEQFPKHCLKILVVDDDDLNRRMMRLILVRYGHDVQVVANGIEALEAVKEQKFDFVFMDLQMPLMDGFEASRRIREWENGGVRTYIVALTASYFPEEGQRLFEVGIDNYIAKPFEVEHIRRLLDVFARSGHHLPAAVHSEADGSPEKHDILDIGKGLQQLSGDVKIYQELLTDFIQGLPGRLSILEQLLTEKDADSLVREAHNLKGVASNLGALQLADYAGKLEKQSIEGGSDRDENLISDLNRAGSNLQKAVTEFLNNREKIILSAEKISLED